MLSAARQEVIHPVTGLQLAQVRKLVALVAARGGGCRRRWPPGPALGAGPARPGAAGRRLPAHHPDHAPTRPAGRHLALGGAPGHRHAGSAAGPGAGAPPPPGAGRHRRRHPGPDPRSPAGRPTAAPGGSRYKPITSATLQGQWTRESVESAVDRELPDQPAGEPD
jgi:hypothetical protein